MTIALAAMVRHPYSGTVKTRLSPRLPAAARARLYHAFVADKLEQLRTLRGAIPWLVYTPPNEEPWFRELAGPGVRLVAQCEGTLGERVAGAFSALFAQHAGVILVDSDTPNLPANYLQAAVDAIARAAPLVIGPADDGGFYLVGLSRPEPRLFDAIEWSSTRTRALTLAAATRLGLPVQLLPPWYDVDRPEDLVRLERDLARDAGAAAPHSWAALAQRTA